MIKISKNIRISKRKYKTLLEWTQEVIENVCNILHISDKNVCDIHIVKNIYDRAYLDWTTNPVYIVIRHDQIINAFIYKHTLTHEYVHYFDYLKYGMWNVDYIKYGYTTRFFENYFEHRAEGIARLLYKKGMTKRDCFVLDNVDFIWFPTKCKKEIK